MAAAHLIIMVNTLVFWFCLSGVPGSARRRIGLQVFLHDVSQVNLD